MAVSNWAKAEAAAAVLSAILLLVGVYFAQRYGSRAVPSIKARSFPRTRGGVGIEVRIQIKSVGLKMLRMKIGAGHLPTLTVMEVTDDGRRYDYRVQDERIVQSLLGQVAGPGEIIRSTEYFHLSSAAPDVVGWRIEFVLDMQHPLRKSRWWTWQETAFMPADHAVADSLDDYDSDGGRDGHLD